MKIAGRVERTERRGELDVAASTEPAMKIAGRAAPSSGFGGSLSGLQRSRR